MKRHTSRTTTRIVMLVLFLWVGISPHLPELNEHVLRAAIIGSILLSTACMIALVRQAMPLARKSLRWLGTAIAGWTLVLGFMIVGSNAVSRELFPYSPGDLHATELLVAISAIFKLAFAAALGMLLARFVESLRWVPALALLITLADIWSVYAPHGVTKTLLEDHATIVGIATIPIPVWGFALSSGAALGIVDIVFCAFYLTVAYLWGLPLRNLLVALPFAITVTFALSIYSVSGAAVPALPAIALAGVLAHADSYWRAFRQPGHQS